MMGGGGVGGTGVILSVLHRWVVWLGELAACFCKVSLRLLSQWRLFVITSRLPLLRSRLICDLVTELSSLLTSYLSLLCEAPPPPPPSTAPPLLTHTHAGTHTHTHLFSLSLSLFHPPPPPPPRVSCLRVCVQAGLIY